MEKDHDLVEYALTIPRIHLAWIGLYALVGGYFTNQLAKGFLAFGLAYTWIAILSYLDLRRRRRP